MRSSAWLSPDKSDYRTCSGLVLNLSGERVNRDLTIEWYHRRRGQVSCGDCRQEKADYPPREDAVSLIRSTLIILLLLPTSQAQSVVVHIATSDAVDLARMIAKDEGYDVRNTKVYYFDLLQTQDGKPLLNGYTSVGFYINGNIRSSISISETTGQAVDMNSREIFDYPDLKSFQERIIRLSKAKRKTAQELADDAGCSSPKVLTNPVAVVGNSR